MKYRWITRSDVPAVLAIDAKASAEPWDESTLIELLRQRQFIGMCACQDDSDAAVAFMVFEMRDDEVALLKLAVDPNFAGQGAELILWNALVRRCRVHGKPHIAVPDGFKVPVGGDEPRHPLIVEARHG